MEKWKKHRSGKLPRKLNTSLLKCAHTKSSVLNCFGISLPTGSSYSSDKYQRCTPRIVIELSWKFLTFWIGASCSYSPSTSPCRYVCLMSQFTMSCSLCSLLMYYPLSIMSIIINLLVDL